jgi:aryl-alcohol dehydrogenase-like predicted oxidoreductase
MPPNIKPDEGYRPMRTIPLGSTDIQISELCLGTMTWGTQTDQVDAHQQIEVSLDAGINIIDTAEMYPVNPVLAETVGDTEVIFGNWIGANPSRRDEYQLATKIAGKNSSFVRIGQDITAETFLEAFDQSLRRLQTDYIDIYQLHWPNRGSYHFRQLWGFDPSAQDKAVTLENMAAVLDAAQGLVKAGKLRHFALSNESAWGTTQWIRQAEDKGLPRVQSIQNEYSLLCRQYDTDLAEMAVNEQITLLAYSPLATGLLTGKYQNGAVPKGSRMDINGSLGGRKTDRVFSAVGAYQEIADRHGLDLTLMSLAWCQTRPFGISAIFGATDVGQLHHILKSADMVLDAEILAEIDAAHRAHPMPY